MVLQVKVSNDVGRFALPICRDSVLDDESPAERPPRRLLRRKRTPEQVPSAQPTPPPARPVTERHHLAGADWLSDYVRKPLKAK